MPADPRRELAINPEVPVLYAIPKRSLVDLLVLYRHCHRQGLPRPNVVLQDLRRGGEGAYHYLAEPGFIQTRKDKTPTAEILKLLSTLREDAARNVQVIPVTILWGKYPGAEERSLLKLLFTDDENAGILQKFFIVMAQGRSNLVLMGQPIQLRDLVDEGAPIDQTARKLQRVLRVHFQRQRTSVLGQKLFNREQVIRRIVGEKPVQAVIASECLKKSASRVKIEAKARHYAREITADLTYSAIRFAEILLSRLWKKIFDGVEHRGMDRVKALATEYELVYMPTHRSHLDYLLMTYIIYVNGLPISHTAAGINLNFWPAGWFIRRMGGFFLRRSFGGNKLYATVFAEYINYLVTHGYPFTFFPEGGRSRSGRLLAPKTGMLSMVVQSYLRNSQRPVALIPVYIGYDKVVEVRSYLKELSGSSKRKESVLQLLQARKFLKNYYGKAYVGFGEPVLLHEELAAIPDWKTTETQKSWYHNFIVSLSHKIATRTNSAAIISNNAVIGLALLSTPQRALPEDDMIGLVDKLLKIQELVPYSPDVALPTGRFAENMRAAERLESFRRFQHAGGDVIHLTEFDAILMSYYKNSILHLFALQSLVARFFQHREQVQIQELIDGAAELYPFLQDEFFLPWPAESIRP